MTKFIKASEVIAAIESLEKEVREEATRTKEYVYKEAYLYGEDAIRLFNDKYADGSSIDWFFQSAQGRLKNLNCQAVPNFSILPLLNCLLTSGMKKNICH